MDEYSAQQADVPMEVVPDSATVADWIPIVAFVLGIINIASWCVPLCGCPFGIAGIVLGVMGLKSKKLRTLAMIGLILSILSIVGTLINAVIGAYLGATGQHQLLNQFKKM